MTPEISEHFSRLNVSRETIERFKIFAALLKKWNPHINLVSKNSLEVLWPRHILDSVQVFRCTKPHGHWLDLGSGGGLPGAIVGIMAGTESPDMKITLIESDQRKSTFLRTVARETGVNFTVLSDRIESVTPQSADIVSARALSNLTSLLGFAERHLSPSGVAVFPKGVSWKNEVSEARKQWQFLVDPVTSITESGAVILKVCGVSRV